jgi:hypothetical protein
MTQDTEAGNRPLSGEAEGRLASDQASVEALTAWLLFRNQIIAADQVMDAETLPKVQMPNGDGFVPDPGPDVDEIKPREMSTAATLPLRRGRARVGVKRLAACHLCWPPSPPSPAPGGRSRVHHPRVVSQCVVA